MTLFSTGPQLPVLTGQNVKSEPHYLLKLFHLPDHVSDILLAGHDLSLQLLGQRFPAQVSFCLWVMCTPPTFSLWRGPSSLNFPHIQVGFRGPWYNHFLPSMTTSRALLGELNSEWTQLYSLACLAPGSWAPLEGSSAAGQLAITGHLWAPTLWVLPFAGNLTMFLLKNFKKFSLSFNLNYILSLSPNPLYPFPSALKYPKACLCIWTLVAKSRQTKNRKHPSTL